MSLGEYSLMGNTPIRLEFLFDIHFSDIIGDDDEGLAALEFQFADLFILFHGQQQAAGGLLVTGPGAADVFAVLEDFGRAAGVDHKVLFPHIFAAALEASADHDDVGEDQGLAAGIVSIDVVTAAVRADITVLFGDISEGDKLEKGNEFGALESVKASSELYSPVSGTVIACNTEVEDSPEKINEDPYGAWIIKVEMSDSAELSSLMTAAEYAQIAK